MLASSVLALQAYAKTSVAHTSKASALAQQRMGLGYAGQTLRLLHNRQSIPGDIWHLPVVPAMDIMAQAFCVLCRWMGCSRCCSAGVCSA